MLIYCLESYTMLVDNMQRVSRVIILQNYKRLRKRGYQCMYLCSLYVNARIHYNSRGIILFQSKFTDSSRIILYKRFVLRTRNASV